MPNDFPRSYIRALIAEDEAERDKAAALHRVVPVETRVASVTAIDEARIRLHPDADEWRTRAACLDLPPELFFPGDHAHATLAHAQEVCDSCPVQAACLEFAMTPPYETFGVWGGTTERQRRRLRKQRRSA